MIGPSVTRQNIALHLVHYLPFSDLLAHARRVDGQDAPATEGSGQIAQSIV